MYFPTLNARPRSAQSMDVFGGYNHNVRIQENEFYDMKNLTSDQAPVLAPRKGRGLYVNGSNVQGLIAKDSLCWIDGSEFVINEYRVDMGLSTDPEMCPKQLISMGAYVIIMPDKKYFNTADFSDYGSIEAEYTTQTDVTFIPCRLDGTEMKPDYIQPTPPAEPANMALWMDTSATPHSLKQYSSGTNTWVGVETTYVKISCPGIGTAFREYDGVKISGLAGQLTADEEGSEVTNAQQLQALEGSHILYGCGEDYILVIGILDTMTNITNAVTVSRKMPAMDFIIENDNRLWGCRYGLNNDGEVVNELYSCKLGDFRNWNVFMGISTDSYAVSLGSDGQFTGAITHAGQPLFFKENCLHKVYGQIPANFQVQTTACRGVQKGCERSLAIVNEILFYKARHAVCSYDGSLPVEASAALGEERYEYAVAAAHGNKYYISMRKTGTAERSLFVYDTAKGMWHKEDDLNVYLFCSCRDELYCATEDNRIIAMLGSGEGYEEPVPWMFETGILGASLPDKKYLVKLNIRLVLEVGSSLNILAQYDSVGPWVNLGFITGTDLRSFTIPVKPRRCDHLRLRVEGEGKGMVFSITKTYSHGSDV